MVRLRRILAALLLGVVGAAQEAPPKPDPHEGERKAYDEIYGSQPEVFRREPNGFLVRMMTGRRGGRALDVAMGQGRNSLWLASQGWSVTGFDISPVAIAEAKREAERRGLKMEALVAPWESFAWGSEQWDLIVFSYYFPREALPKVWEALKPGGLILIEVFHMDTAKVRPLGGGYRDNELFQLLQNYRMLVYEDVEDRQEWGLPFGATNRLVRVLAQKNAKSVPNCQWEGKSYRQQEFMCWGVMRWACGAEGWAAAGRCRK